MALSPATRQSIYDGATNLLSTPSIGTVNVRFLMPGLAWAFDWAS
jgi:hypothetical protein